MTASTFEKAAGRLRRSKYGIVFKGHATAIAKVKKIAAQGRAYSPIAAHALDWAEAVGLTIQCVHEKKPPLRDKGHGQVRGSYTIHTKRIRLYVSRHVGEAEIINSLVHEIRHMWHDDKNLMFGNWLENNEPWRFSPAVTAAQNACFEADAYAHGRAAESEYTLRAALDDPAAALQRHFKAWFGRRGPGAAYRKQHLISSADLLPAAKIQRGVAVLRRAFGLHVKPKQQGGLDPACRVSLERLGRSFAGVNYIAEMPQSDRDFLRRMLAPLPTLTDYQRPGALPHQALACLKAHKRETLQYPQQRYPLPG